MKWHSNTVIAKSCICCGCFHPWRSLFTALFCLIDVKGNLCNMMNFMSAERLLGFQGKYYFTKITLFKVERWRSEIALQKCSVSVALKSCPDGSFVKSTGASSL